MRHRFELGQSHQTGNWILRHKEEKSRTGITVSTIPNSHAMVACFLDAKLLQKSPSLYIIPLVILSCLKNEMKSINNCLILFVNVAK